MGCVYHPDRDSVAYCDHCEAELCESCTLRVEGGRSVCHRCLLALSLNDVKSETTMREQEEEDQRVGLHKKWRPTYIESVLTIGLVLVLGLVGLRFYWDRTELKSAITLDVTDPVELLAEFQAILAHYSVANGNRYPDSLHELLPAILMMQQRTAGCYGILTTTSMSAKAISSALSRNQQFQERT